MATQDCINAMNAAAGRQLNDDELVEIIEELESRRDAIRAANTSISLEEAALQAAEELGEQARAAAIIEKRNAAINHRKRLEALNYLKQNWSDRLDLGIESLLTGVNTARPGARRSAAAAQKELSDYYVGGILNELERSGHLPLLTSGSMDREITKALWEINQDAPDLRGITKESKEIAQILRKWQEIARIDANKAGAAIGKLDNYVARQTHDPYKLEAAKFEAWKNYILPRLDIERTFPKNSNADDFLWEAYKGLVSGVHLKNVTAKQGFIGPRNLAKKMSQERVLHFKDADSWFEYNQEFGSGSLREAVLGGLDHMGASTGLMRKLGINPEANLNSIISQLQTTVVRDDPSALKMLDEFSRSKMKNRMMEVDGTTKMAVSGIGARVGSNLRAIQSMAKLGGAVLSAVSDIPIAASEMRYQGKTYLGSMADLVVGLLEGKKTAEKREILSSLGVYFDSMRGDVVNRFSADDSLGGTMTRLQRRFFKFNGLTWWTDSMRSSAALMMSHNLAYNRGKSLSELGDLGRTLELYGISESRWDAVRSLSSKEADGRQYMTPEAIDNIGDDTLKGIIESEGRTANKSAIEELREDLKSQLRAFITDRASYAVITPDARTNAIMRQGTQPGTLSGELLRFVGQFKAFPVAVLQKSIGRELYGRGYNVAGYNQKFKPLRELWSALTHGNGEFLGLAQLMLWTTAFGYLAMSIKDISKGRTPRDPNQSATWVAAMLQGGALGIYGDFLFGETNRVGGGPIQTLAGPVLGSAEDLHGLYIRMINGDDSAAASFRFALNNTPFINLFYARLAMDHLFFYQMQESMNPGYLRRMERRVEKENNQTFLISPR